MVSSARTAACTYVCVCGVYVLCAFYVLCVVCVNVLCYLCDFCMHACVHFVHVCMHPGLKEYTKLYSYFVQKLEADNTKLNIHAIKIWHHVMRLLQTYQCRYIN